MDEIILERLVTCPHCNGMCGERDSRNSISGIVTVARDCDCGCTYLRYDEIMFLKKPGEETFITMNAGRNKVLTEDQALSAIECPERLAAIWQRTP